MAKRKVAGFCVNQHVIYPTHGVGKITAIEKQTVAGMLMELFIIQFEKDKMILRVPTAKAKSVGLRRLASPKDVTKSLRALKTRARVKRVMWARRAQEYEQKINSGDLVALSEVVRDLHRSDDQREQSYSERQLYELSLERLVREHSALDGISEAEAMEKLVTILESRRGSGSGTRATTTTEPTPLPTLPEVLGS